MPNTLLTPTQVLREALRVLHNNLVFVKNVNKQYSKEFAVAGAKVGSTINVRLPNRYYVTKATALAAQNTTEQTTPVQLTTNYQVGLNFTQQELTLSLDDFSKRILVPAMARLASQIDQDGLAQCVNIYNQVGTAGTTPGTPSAGPFANALLNYTAPQVFLNSGMMLDYTATPRDENRRCVLNPAAMAASVGGLSGLFQDAKEVGEQYRKGVMGHALGFEFAMDQNVNLLSTGTRHGTAANFQVATTSTTGDTTLAVKGFTALDTFKAGEIISIANVNGVNPENQTSTGINQMFVVTQDATLTNGTGTLHVSPSIIVAGAGIANGTVDALPQQNAVITLLSGLRVEPVPYEHLLPPGRLHPGDGGPGDAERRGFRGPRYL